MATLDQAKPGNRFRVERFDGPAELIQRLMEMGLLEDEEILVLNLAPLGDPIEIEYGSTRLSLRKREASVIHGTILPAS